MNSEKVLTVLIVDDDADDRFFMERAFRVDSPTTQIYLARSGQQALDMLVLLQLTPDVILLDLNMPALDGFQVLDHLKRSPWYHQILVVVLTTSNALADKERAYKLGADEFMTKPTTQRGLQEIVEWIRQNWTNAWYKLSCIKGSF